MKQKNKGKNKIKDKEVGGIPVDSEYVVFYYRYIWKYESYMGKSTKELVNILNIHPKVKDFKF